MKTSQRNVLALVGGLLLSIVSSLFADSADSRLGGMRLLDGFEHQALEGIDSKVGVIQKKKGLKINYEIGTLPKAGMPRMGGQFTDKAKALPEVDLTWYREQTINGQAVHLAKRKDGVLLVSFPQKGINFSAQIDSEEELTDALLMILSYPTAAKGADSND